MNLTWKLFTAQARHHQVRLMLTVVAMMAAIGIVLWVVSAYEAIASKFDEQTEEFVGQYDVFAVPKSLDDALSPELIQSLEMHPAVTDANPVAQFRMWFRRVGETPDEAATARRGLGRMGPTVVGTQSREPRYPLVDGRWLSPEATDETVVSSGVAEALQLKPGDSIQFRTEHTDPPIFRVVGIVEQVEGVEFAMTRTKGGAPGGTNRGPASLAAYVPLAQIERLTGADPKLNLLELRLQQQATTEEFSGIIQSATPAAELIRPEDVRAKLAAGFQAEGARKQAYFVTALSILASAFIIFTTLSMGVNERARQLAVLRAVGLNKKQVALLVLVEALVLAIIGWIGGLLGGWALLHLLARATPALFPQGVSLGWMSLLLTGGCAIVGAGLASVFPIWKATRISPLEAMAPLQMISRRSEWYATTGLLSVFMIFLNPVLVFIPGVPEALRMWLILGVGIPTTVVGFLLLTPLVVLGIEKLFSPLVAGLLRLQPNLVQTQLSNHMWRSAGIAASLMLGLGLFTATQVWGWSMLGGFLPGRWSPDAIVRFQPAVTEQNIEKMLNASGFRAGEVLPIAVEQTRLAGDPLRSGERDSAVRQDNVSLIGLDSEKAFSGDDPLFRFKLVQGDRAEVIQQLKAGRNCVVPETFIKYADLKLGDKIGLIPPRHPETSIDYTIVGFAAMPGSNWMTKTSGIRKQSVRTAGLVFAPYQQVRKDFDLPDGEFFWGNVEPGTTQEDLEESLLPLAATGSRSDGVPSGSREKGGNERSSGAGNANSSSQRAPPGGSPRGARRGGRRGGARGDQPVQVTLLKDVRESLRSRGGGAVEAMGYLPLITLIIVSLGVVNTIAASVRAHRWEFGILRSVGLTRWKLSRLVISEALLIGLVASVLSLAFGIVTGWTCLGLIRYVSNPWFEGVKTPLTIPWSQLFQGYVLMFALCFFAALWPAISAGRTEPLKLLQAGRSAT